MPQAGYPLSLIEVGQLKNVSLLTKSAYLLDLPLSVLRCRKLLRDFRPNVVIGVGGYASGPAMGAAILGGIPTLAVEPNAFPGLANRLVGKRVDAAAVNFQAAAKYFRNPQVTGIPVRDEFFPPRGLVPGRVARICSSLEAARAPVSSTRSCRRSRASLLAGGARSHILHQAGARHADATLAAYHAGDAPHESLAGATPFLMTCRAASRPPIWSCRAAGPARLPNWRRQGSRRCSFRFPQAADDHQRKNAEALAEAGAAPMLLEAALTPEILLQTLIGLLKNRLALERMSAQARTLAHPDATSRIAAMAIEVAR